MGGGFMFAANSATFSAATRSFPNPASCTGSQPCYCCENDSVFGPVPSRTEVESAILQLQRILHGVSSTKAVVEGFHGQLYHHQHSNMLQYPGFIKVSNAFAMMQAEPPLQNLVVSISCDKAVWEAILSNKAVDDLRGSIAAAGKEEKPEESELAEVIWKWMIGFTKSKVIEMVEKLASMVTLMFNLGPKPTPAELKHVVLDDKVGSSLLLSIVILLIVVVTRAHESSLSQ